MRMSEERFEEVRIAVTLGGGGELMDKIIAVQYATQNEETWFLKIVTILASVDKTEAKQFFRELIARSADEMFANNAAAATRDFMSACG